MTKAKNPPRYRATQYDKTGERAVWLTLHPDSLHIDDGNEVRSWPLSEVFAGQVGQGEAECISFTTRPDIRLIVARDVLEMVRAATKGEPYTQPRTWRIPLGSVLLFAYLILCWVLWHFFD